MQIKTVSSPDTATKTYTHGFRYTKNGLKKRNGETQTDKKLKRIAGESSTFMPNVFQIA
jgi:hypothetical protein